MRFHALISSIHYDPKKGAVKIALIATSHMSLDELATLSPSDEPVQVTLESKQTKIDVFPLAPTDEEITLSEEAEERLKDAADRLRQGDEDEVEGGGQGGII